MEHSTPCFRQALIAYAISLSTAGCSGSYMSATFSLFRSMASVYWMRSFVPKDANRIPALMKSSTRTALPGISIMMPRVAVSTSTPQSFIMLRAWTNSLGWLTIGNITPRLS